MAATKTKSKTKHDDGPEMTMIKALGHPFRLRALHILNERVASPKKIANEIGVDVNKVAYHVKELEKLGCIELVDTKPRRGATEHFYRATRRAELTDKEWIHVPRNLKDDIVGEHMEAIGPNISAALADGTFNARNDRRQSWITMAVTEAGWTEAMVILAEAEARLRALEEENANRLAESGEESVLLAVSMMGFERSPGRT